MLELGSQAARHQRRRAFHHEALLYEGSQEFTDTVERFIRDGLDAGESVMVAVTRPKVGYLRDALGADADRVVFSDMAELGRNPSLILPAWRAFVDRHHGDGGPVRGVGEPVWPGRSDSETDECLLHESLLNTAFADGTPFWLLCPYDVSALDEHVVEAARQHHPFTLSNGKRLRSDAYEDTTAAALAGPLPAPEQVRAQLGFGQSDLSLVRALVARHAHQAGIDAQRGDDLVVAVNEIATNSVQHGGGQGLLRIWSENGSLVCEVRDGGRISEPLVGREAPSARARDGRGVWMANHLCDLVQLRSSSAGTVARLHMGTQPVGAEHKPDSVVEYSG